MRILGYDYSLIEDAEQELIGAFGRFHAAKQIIQIAKGLAPQQRCSTVLHEMLEVINYHLQLSLEHQVLMSLEAALFDALTQNGVDLWPLTRELDAIMEPKKGEVDGIQ